MKSFRPSALLVALLLPLAAVAIPPPAQPPAAVAVVNPEQAPLLAAARAGERIVAVGDHGVILLSDDEGKSFRQAKAVPTQVLLTALSFIDAKQGWAAGHDGTVLATSDGGETWRLQRTDTQGDRPLFAIHFEDARHGLAVGLFGTAISTDDGGASWQPLAIASGERPDRHLFTLFGGRGRPLFVGAESGVLFRSTDGGRVWQEIQTDNTGSFWAGTALEGQAWLVAGLRGHVYQSLDDGQSWSALDSGTQQSLTAVARLRDGRLLLAGLGGTLLSRAPGGTGFSPQTRADRANLAAIVETAAGTLLLGGGGVGR
ncbi:MAG: glycosyl hydrolase [Nevskiaceae bacterium]|nr:MAG: glycosyl hydrolase [Nevskiaceae bacterium]TAM28605.1 MAG: glycosyl hydrolase [Nevskiaceae bacterium]